MKILAVGDLHGRIECLERAVAEFRRKECDKLILIGDYTDSFDRSVEDQIECLRAIAYYYNKYGEQIEAIIGNHDHPAYVHNKRCTGTRGELAATFSKYYEKVHYRVAFEHGDYLFTHAGINQLWWNRHQTKFDFMQEKFGPLKKAETLNMLWDSRFFPMFFEVGTAREGWSETGSIFWSDRGENERWRVTGFNQVVGHSPCAEIINTNLHGSKIYYIDCLGKRPDDFLFLNV